MLLSAVGAAHQEVLRGHSDRDFGNLFTAC